ncbi:MAG: Holliday junction resolvase RuvX, partial [Bacilli bacterium]
MDKYVGLDLGTTTLGISSSDILGIVHPKENFVFEKGNYKKALEHISSFLKEGNYVNVVIGLPLQIDRQEGERCASVRRFASDLKNICENINIFFCDESYSTIEARERLKDCGYKEDKIKKVIDMYSAVVI